MTLQDALFNWLQIKIVSDARPDDFAAKETLDFFELILTEDHQLTSFRIAAEDATMIHVQYEAGGKSKKQLFDLESSRQLLADIESNPKYA
ncbi:hypothetical protein [Paenibacillus contaminans]|uniref:Uncharacterized protein n=1 Tax=Paenibacillus contaminans TaxID=450362 RepID=A0A329MKC2_9BACL|nr:hypothetical protein [Paenibacillus contaminans]RAV19766.1 hypothetical protein DQG23_17630 [Paenibacillus contaminans]